MALKTEFTVGGKTYVRNGATNGVDGTIGGVRITHWSEVPEGERLTGETVRRNGKVSLTVTEGDEGLYRELERLFWEANLDGLTLASAKDETGRVH